MAFSIQVLSEQIRNAAGTTTFHRLLLHSLKHKNSNSNILVQVANIKKTYFWYFS